MYDTPVVDVCEGLSKLGGPDDHLVRRRPDPLRQRTSCGPVGNDPGEPRFTTTVTHNCCGEDVRVITQTGQRTRLCLAHRPSFGLIGLHDHLDATTTIPSCIQPGSARDCDQLLQLDVVRQGGAEQLR